MDNPKFVHDCEHCTHIGSTQAFDVYHCHHHTLIVRYSSEGPDYTSGHPEIWRQMIKERAGMKLDDMRCAVTFYDESKSDQGNARKAG